MSQELPEGTVTVLFTDVVGSTDLTTSRGDEAAQEMLRAQRDLVPADTGWALALWDTAVGQNPMNK
jgi:hypothetical protein